MSPETIARESPEGVKLETSAEEREHWIANGFLSVWPTDIKRLLRDIATILAEVARLKAELADARSIIKWNKKASAQNVTAREATARAEEREKIKAGLEYRLNEHLCEMEEGWDDSVHGFNEAWTVMSAYFARSAP